MENSVWGLFLPRLSSNIDAFSPHHTVLNKTIMSKNLILYQPYEIKILRIFCIKIFKIEPQKYFPTNQIFWIQN